MLSAAVENSFGAVVITDTAGAIEYVSPSFEELTGYHARDVIGRHASILSADDDLDRSIRAAVGAGGQWRGEIKNKRPDGEEYYVLTSIQALRSEDGEITHYVGVNIDITALKEAEERMRAIATAVSDVIVVMDEDGLLLEVLAPRERVELLGLPPPEDLRGSRVHEFLPHDQAEWVLEFVRETISSGKPREAEALLDLPSGPTWVSSRSAPLSLGDGRTVAVIHALDITERKRLEEELQRLREETEAEAEEGVKRAAEYGLTFRETTVLNLIARGRSDREIAALLGLSPFTVNKHSSNLVRKLGARSRSQAAARAVREYII